MLCCTTDRNRYSQPLDLQPLFLLAAEQHALALLLLVILELVDDDSDNLKDKQQHCSKG